MNNILEHWQHPFNRGIIPSNRQGTARSDVCGDEITLALHEKDGQIIGAYFDGEGCTICLGMASLLTHWLIGRNLADAKQLDRAGFFSLAGIPIKKRREGCALVALDALRQALG